MVQVITNLLERSDNERSSATVSGRGSARSPTSAAAAWGRTRSTNTSSAAAAGARARGQEGLQRSQSRYIPPAARAAAAAAAAEAGAAPGTIGTSSSSGGIQPWRRKTSTTSGLPGDRGPDVDRDGYDTRGGAAVGDSSFPAGRTGDGSRGSAGLGEFLREEEEGGREEEEEEEKDESDDDEEMFELEMSAVVEAVEG